MGNWHCPDYSLLIAYPQGGGAGGGLAGGVGGARPGSQKEGGGGAV